METSCFHFSVKSVFEVESAVESFESTYSACFGYSDERPDEIVPICSVVEVVDFQ